MIVDSKESDVLFGILNVDVWQTVCCLFSRLYDRCNPMLGFVDTNLNV